MSNGDEGPRVWRDEEGLHVDVRGLPCPEPLVTVLRLIDGGEAGDCLVAHLSQEPLLLYPELAERGWRHRLVVADQPDHVALEMVRPRA
jgi:TusA-related sulfurtransferase